MRRDAVAVWVGPKRAEKRATGDTPFASGGTDEGVCLYTSFSRTKYSTCSYTAWEESSHGYYVVDGEDRGGGRDLELREYGEGGAGGDHARNRYAD